MKDNLKSFIQNNKEAFDELEPSNSSWQDLESKWHKKPQGKVIAVRTLWKYAAAILAIIVCGVAIYLGTKKHDEQSLIVHKTPEGQVQSLPDTAETPAQVNVDQVQPAMAQKPTQTEPEPEIIEKISPTDNSIYSFTKDIKNKQAQLASLKLKDPELYQKFEEDLASLAVSFEALKQSRGKNINNEQVLKAMLQNLHFQSVLLNKQLEITRQLNENSKIDDTLKTL